MYVLQSLVRVFTLSIYEQYLLLVKILKEEKMGFNNFRPGPREMHKATCSDCGKEIEVPFKPTEGKPVYCRECYQKKKKY